MVGVLREWIYAFPLASNIIGRLDLEFGEVS